MSGFKTPEGACERARFAADTAPFLRVTIDGDGLMAICGASEAGVGVSSKDLVDVSEATSGAVHLNGPYVQTYTAAGVITVGSHRVLYAAAGGKVSATGTVPVAILTDHKSATADGQYVYGVPIQAALEAGLGALVINHTVSAAEATANTAAIDTGFGTLIAGRKDVQVAIFAANGDDVTLDAYTVSAGTVTVDNTGSTGLLENQVIRVICYPTAVTV